MSKRRQRWGAVGALAAASWEASPAASLGLMAATVMSALLPTAAIVAMGALVGSLPATIRAGGLAAPEGHSTLLLLLLVAVLQVAGATLGAILDPLTAWLGRRVRRDLEGRIISAVCAPPTIDHLDDSDVLGLLARVRGTGASWMEWITIEAVLGGVLQRLRGAVAVAGGLAVVASARWWLAAVLAASLAAAAWAWRGLLDDFGDLLNETEAGRRATYLSALSTTLDAAKDIRILGLADWLRERYLAEGRTAERLSASRWMRRTVERHLPQLLVSAALATTLITVGILGARGALSLAAVSATLAAAVAVASDDSLELVRPHPLLRIGLPVVAAVSELEARLMHSRGTAPRRAAAAKLPANAPAVELRMEGVSFRYPGADHDVLRGVDLRIRAGTSVALVGLNGAGKSTLVQLLLGLRRATGGRLLIDGMDMADVDPVDWSGRLSASFQDAVHYAVTPAQSIAIDAADAVPDPARLRRSAERAGILDRIERLPSGWDTPLSRQLAGGADLSGGEWQRLGLARALYAVERGARVLILDEPTAALDVRAEAELYDHFVEMTRGITTVLISHRFSTVRCADTICVLDEGRIVEEGTHDELLRRHGRYAQMFTAQAEPFGDGQTSPPESV